MFRMCRNIFGTGKAVFLDSGFCVAKDISELETKGVYEGDLINKRRYWPKGVPGEFIGTNFQDWDIGDVGMLETKTQENK